PSTTRGGLPMADREIAEIKRVFVSRLDTLAHILDTDARHIEDFDATLQARLAPDMAPLGTQVVFACNQPHGFAWWCAGLPVENLPPEVASLALAREHIQRTREQVAAIDAQDERLDQVKRIVVGPDRYCDLPGRQYVGDFLLPNFYFHISMAYAILRHLGVPLGKADY